MPLEETDVIDIITSGPDRQLNPVITDAGITEDEAERYALLVEKLRTYMSYCISEDFAQDYPDACLDKVRFLVISRTPPTRKMSEIQELVSRGPGPVRIPVAFEVSP